MEEVEEEEDMSKSSTVAHFDAQTFCMRVSNNAHLDHGRKAELLQRGYPLFLRVFFS